jgi:hypothetical protein
MTAAEMSNVPASNQANTTALRRRERFVLELSGKSCDNTTARLSNIASDSSP